MPFPGDDLFPADDLYPGELMPGRATNDPTNYFAIGKQTAKGNEAGTFHYLRHLDGTGAEVGEDIETVREGGDGQEAGLRFKTAINFDGAAVAFARPEIAARLLAYVLGADAATIPNGAATVASGVANEHIAFPGPTLPYLTIDQFWADQVERGLDTKVTGLDIEWEQGRPLKMTAQFVGGGSMYFPASPGTPTREVGRPFMYPGASVWLNGAANTQITKGKISIKRNVDDGVRTNALSREDVIETNFDIDVDLTLKFEGSGESLYDKTHAGASGGTQIPIDLSTTSLGMYSVVGAGTSRRHLQVDLPLLDMVGARVNKLEPDGKTMYADLALAGIKGATHQIIARTTIASIAALV